MTPQEYQLTARLASGSATWRNYVTNLLNNPQVVNTSNYAAFYDTTTQASGGITAENLVTFNTIDVANGISLVQGSKITFSNSGAYLVNLLAQFRFTGGSSFYDVTTWYKINGTNATNSAYTFVMTSGQGSQTLANIEDIAYLNAGDYIQFYWWSNITQASINLYTTPAGSNPTRPASPSVNISISQLN